MKVMSSRMEAILCATAVICALAMLAVPASAATGKPANTEQIFGVGARADAMGDAFVALANDPTATFWNPAGLAYLQGTDVTAVVKSIPSFTQTTNITIDNGGPFGGFDTAVRTDATSSHISSTDAGFVSVSTPIGKSKGTLAISRALAGYFDRGLSETQLFIGAAPGDPSQVLTSTQDHFRLDYNTLSYGWKPAAKWSVGFGLVQAIAEASRVGSIATTSAGSSTPVINAVPASATDGKGYGCMVGALWNPEWNIAGELTFGGSYLTRITLSDFQSTVFGDQRPDRLLLGANYRQLVPGTSGNEVQWSLQLSRNGEANAGAGGELARNAVWNFYAGGEYDIHRGNLSLPVRYGLFTNKTPNATVYGSETWLTLGFGASQSKADWQAEFALQQGLRTGMSLMSFSGGYAF